ncbi:unnamed protein product [Pleuronectes platessa]|uniref:Uncharacterized protein n=1 Tax=Pleuronectes platessa TaxID=8262 RepID=A0A9N7YUP0_PLEPL|nr:unnamed protein product [Pleuronectes platessa]
MAKPGQPGVEEHWRAQSYDPIQHLWDQLCYMVVTYSLSTPPLTVMQMSSGLWFCAVSSEVKCCVDTTALGPGHGGTGGRSDGAIKRLTHAGAANQHLSLAAVIQHVASDRGGSERPDRLRGILGGWLQEEGGMEGVNELEEEKMERHPHPLLSICSLPLVHMLLVSNFFLLSPLTDVSSTVKKVPPPPDRMENRIVKAPGVIFTRVWSRKSKYHDSYLSCSRRARETPHSQIGPFPNGRHAAARAVSLSLSSPPYISRILSGLVKEL